MASPTSTGLTRSCRRRCMGCDPCWICRKSYPASIAIAYSGGGSGGGSSSGGDIWRGCCGYAQGTFVPHVPYGPNAGYDNGVTIHHTFRDPATYGQVGVSQIGGICCAGWQFKRTLFQLRQSFTSGGDLGDVPLVALCNGTNGESYWPNAITEYENSADALVACEVSVHVGNYLGLGFSDATVAANADSTQVSVRIMERFAGHCFSGGLFFASQLRARYEVIRIQRYSTHLPKPCPTSGTFAVPYFGTTLITPLGPAVENYGGIIASLPPCVDTVNDYSVSVTL